jgi:hypothetical protein
VGNPFVRLDCIFETTTAMTITFVKMQASLPELSPSKNADTLSEFSQDYLSILIFQG